MKLYVLIQIFVQKKTRDTAFQYNDTVMKRICRWTRSRVPCFELVWFQYGPRETLHSGLHLGLYYLKDSTSSFIVKDWSHRLRLPVQAALFVTASRTCYGIPNVEFWTVKNQYIEYYCWYLEMLEWGRANSPTPPTPTFINGSHPSPKKSKFSEPYQRLSQLFVPTYHPRGPWSFPDNLETIAHLFLSYEQTNEQIYISRCLCGV